MWKRVKNEMDKVEIMGWERKWWAKRKLGPSKIWVGPVPNRKGKKEKLQLDAKNMQRRLRREVCGQDWIHHPLFYLSLVYIYSLILPQLAILFCQFTFLFSRLLITEIIVKTKLQEYTDRCALHSSIKSILCAL